MGDLSRFHHSALEIPQKQFVGVRNCVLYDLVGRSCNPFIPLFFPFVPKVVSAMYVICVMFIIVKKNVCKI